MSKRLTKDARWICVLVEQRTTAFGGTPGRSVMNIGRWSWDVPEAKALEESVQWDKCRFIQSFVVDVDLYKYSKDWRKVGKLAGQYFLKRQMIKKEDIYYY